MARLLKRCSRLSLVVVPLEGRIEEPAVSKTEAEFGLEALMNFEPWPVRGFEARLRHEFDPWFLNTDGKRLSPQDSRRLKALAESHDVVWFRGTAIPNGSGISHWPRSVLDIDDIPSQYHWSEARSAHSLKKKALALRRCWFSKRRERTLLGRFGVLGVCSKADRQYMGDDDRIHIIPNGFNLPEVQTTRMLSQPPRIGFIGTLRHPPNRDGLEWFIRKVWPRLKAEVPAVRLRLIGAETDTGISASGADIDGLGWVEDPATEIASWCLMVVPVQAGGGTRIKVAEGFARKCPVVSTPLGAFGYEVQTEAEILFAETPNQFTQACTRLVREPRLGSEIAERAFEKYRRCWTWDAIEPCVAGAIEKVMRDCPRRISG